MSHHDLTTLLNQAADSVAKGVSPPTLNARPPQARRAVWLAPLAAATSVVVIAVGTVAFTDREDAGEAASRTAAKATASPSVEDGSNSLLGSLCVFPGAFVRSDGSTPRDPSRFQDSLTVKRGTATEVMWSLAEIGTEATLSRVDVTPNVVVARSRARGTQTFTVRGAESMRLELGGTSSNGTRCAVTGYTLEVDGQPPGRSLSEQAQPLVSTRLVAVEGRRVTLAGALEPRSSQQVGMYALDGWGSGGEVTYTLLGDVTVAANGDYQFQHTFDRAGEYLIAARTQEQGVFAGHMSEPLKVVVR